MTEPEDDVFGALKKSLATLIPAINAASIQLSGFTGAMGPMGRILEEVGQATKKLTTIFKDGLLAPFQGAIDVFKAFGRTIGDPGKVFEGISKKFKSTLDSLKETIGDSALGTALSSFSASFKRVLGAPAATPAGKAGAPAVTPAATVPNVGAFGSLAKHAAPGTAANPFSLPLAPPAPPSGLGKAAGAAGGAVGAVAGGAASALSGVAGALGAVAGGAGAALGAAVGLGEAMASFVGKANPAVLQLFTTAMDDLQAVIGQALVPIMRVVIDVVRLFADTFTTFATTIGSAIGQMLNAFKPVLTIMADIFGRVGQAFGRVLGAIVPIVQQLAAAYAEVYKAVEPIIDLLIDVFSEVLVGAISLLAEVVKAVVPIIIQFVQAIKSVFDVVVNFIRQLFGLKLSPAGTKPTSSVGAAAKGTNITDVSSYVAQAQKSAFSLGTGAASPAEKTAAATTMMADILGGIKDLINDLPGKLAKISWKVLKSIDESLGGAKEDEEGVAGSGISTGSKWLDRNLPSAVPGGDLFARGYRFFNGTKGTVGS